MTTDKKPVTYPTFQTCMAEQGLEIPEDKLTALVTLGEKKLAQYAAELFDLAAAAIRDKAFEKSSLDKFLANLLSGLRAQKDALKSGIMGHPNFRRLESNYATVEAQVFQKDGQGLGTRVVNVTMEDIRKDFSTAGLPERSKLYDSLVTSEFHRPGGNANRVLQLVNDVGPNDVDVLEPLLVMGDEANIMVCTNSRPDVLCPPESDGKPAVDFRKLPKSYDLERAYRKAENSPLKGLQEQPLATKWLLGVGQPNARRPYHPQLNPSPVLPQFVESNPMLRVPVSTLAMLGLARSYTKFKVGARIAGFHTGGKHTLPTLVKNGEVATLDCTINDLHEAELHALGLYCALPWKGKDYAVAFDVPSAFVPVPTGDEQEDANAVLASKVAYQMMAIELGHELKQALRYARGMAVGCEQIQALLLKKFMLYVTPDLGSADQETLARKPLAKVSIVVTSDAPGSYLAKAAFVPHTFLGGVELTLKVQAQIDQGKKQ
jgi:predicted component of type VI protein secretion system